MPPYTPEQREGSMKSNWRFLFLIPVALAWFGCSDPNGPRLPQDEKYPGEEEGEDPGTALNQPLPPGQVWFS